MSFSRFSSTGQGRAAFATHSAYDQALTETCVALKVSLYRLGALLGCSALNSQVYRWKSGARRPGSLFMVRLWMLLAWRLRDGVDFARIRFVNWDANPITFELRPEKRRPKGERPQVRGRAMLRTGD